MEEKVLEILAELCADDIVKEDRDIDILEEGLIDSLDYVELLVSFEDAFGIVMAPSKYTRDEMNTPNKIIEQVRKKLAK